MKIVVELNKTDINYLQDVLIWQVNKMKSKQARIVYDKIEEALGARIRDDTSRDK